MAVKELILFVTNRCQLNCYFCCNADVHKTGEELTVENYERIAKSLSRPLNRLPISGGEPILRKDLLDIVKVFYNYNGVRKIDIPVNGFEPEKTLKFVKDICAACPDLILSICVSLNGFEETDAKMRGNLNAFKKSVETLDLISRYKKERGWKGEKRLKIFLNTVVTPENIGEIYPFSGWARKRFPDAYLSLLMVRSNDTSGTKRPISLSGEEVHRLRPLILDNLVYSTKEWSLMKRIYLYIANMMWVDIAEKIASGGRTAFKCVAHRYNRVIYPDGGVGICEMLPPFANIKNFGFDMEKLDEHYKMYDKKLDCACMHACFFFPSVANYPLNILSYFFDSLRLKFMRRR